MSDKPQDWDRSRDEIISGEYVLGVLSEDDRRRVEARMRTDPKFAKQVHRWQTNLADFNDDYGEVTPPAQIYNKIEARLFGLDGEPQVGLWRLLWGSVSLWRGLAFGAVVLAVGIAVADRLVLGPQTSTKPLVAELTGMDSPISLVALYDSASGRLSLTPAALNQDQPKSLELWLIDGDLPPKSLGVLPERGGAVTIEASLRQLISAGKTLAITVEPLGGAPDGKPTTSPIAIGKTRLL